MPSGDGFQVKDGGYVHFFFHLCDPCSADPCRPCTSWFLLCGDSIDLEHLTFLVYSSKNNKKVGRKKKEEGLKTLYRKQAPQTKNKTHKETEGANGCKMYANNNELCTKYKTSTQARQSLTHLWKFYSQEYKDMTRSELHSLWWVNTHCWAQSPAFLLPADDKAQPEEGKGHCQGAREAEHSRGFLRLLYKYRITSKKKIHTRGYDNFYI